MPGLASDSTLGAWELWVFFVVGVVGLLIASRSAPDTCGGGPPSRETRCFPRTCGTRCSRWSRVSLYVSFKAPAWSKPRWMRENPPGWLDLGGPGQTGVSAVGYAALVTVLVAAVVVWWALDLSVVALVVGLAFIVPILVAARSRLR